MTAPSPKPASGNPTPDSVWHDLGMKKPYFPPFRPEERGKWMASENYKRALEALAKRGNLRENEPPPKDLAFWRPDPKGIEGPVPPEPNAPSSETSSSSQPTPKPATKPPQPGSVLNAKKQNYPPLTPEERKAARARGEERLAEALARRGK